MANVKTAILLSGGMDSIAIAYWHRPDIAITIDYGQLPAAAEVRASEAVTDAIGIDHYVVRADLSNLGSGDMAGTPALEVAKVPEWWPFRNQMLITLAAMKAVSLNVGTLLMGTLQTDGAHADGRPDFIDAMNKVLQLQEGELQLETPAIGLSAVELIRRSQVPMEVLAWAHSCHKAEYACGTCRGCRKHYETMAELGVNPY
jgi:7-cyano-7-deazaguanine synthase